MQSSLLLLARAAPGRLRRGFPLGVAVAAVAFLLPFLLLGDGPDFRFPDRSPGAGTTSPALPAPGLARPDFTAGPADAERAFWTWERAKRNSARIWESQIPGTGLYESFYCGCQIYRKGDSGGRVDPETCDYRTRKDSTRAGRLEWEHIVPAAVIGAGRSCWSDGAPECTDKDGAPFKGRACCLIADPDFNLAATDPVNLVPAVGEVNGDRSDFPFGLLSGESRSYGACDMEIDPHLRIAEPPDSRRGDIARIWAYMSMAYGIRISPGAARLYTDWSRADPVDEEEIRINRAIRAAGHRPNPFVLQSGSP